MRTAVWAWGSRHEAGRQEGFSSRSPGGAALTRRTAAAGASCHSYLIHVLLLLSTLPRACVPLLVFSSTGIVATTNTAELSSASESSILTRGMPLQRVVLRPSPERRLSLRRRHWLRRRPMIPCVNHDTAKSAVLSQTSQSSRHKTGGDLNPQCLRI